VFVAMQTTLISSCRLQAAVCPSYGNTGRVSPCQSRAYRKCALGDASHQPSSLFWIHLVIFLPFLLVMMSIQLKQRVEDTNQMHEIFSSANTNDRRDLGYLKSYWVSISHSRLAEQRQI
jgi:hypothetical protein